MVAQSHKIAYTSLRGFVHTLSVVILGIVFFMSYLTSTETSTHKYDSKILSLQGVKIEKNGGMVIGTMKATNFRQVWILFMHFGTKQVNVYNIKHVEIRI